MEEQKPQLKIGDLHRVLQLVFEVGCEIRASLGDSIRKGESVERTALNLTDTVEEDYGRVNRYIEKPYFDLYSKRWKTSKIPVYAQEHRWRVNFCVERNSHLGSGLSIALSEVHNEGEGLRELETISKDLEKIFDLPYLPKIYRNGKPVEGVTVK